MHDGLMPAIIQDARTRNVLMLGYMNAQALEATRTGGKVTFFSRSKQRLWTKGETSGHFLSVVSIALDCDADALLITAHPHGPVCHTGTDTCWNEPNEPASFLLHLERIIQERAQAPSESSYTARLLAKGTPKVAQKVGEEAVETVIEALQGNRERFLEECADLLYHLLVLIKDQGLELADVEAVLRKRHQPD